MSKLDDLSIEARTVLGSLFGLSGECSLRFQMIDNVPSPEMQVALDELVAAEAITVEKQPRGAIKYEKVHGLDLTEYRKECFERVINGTAPSIRIFVKRNPE